ncbi:MAG TPA: molybdopterin molybdotransferase MoeA [Dongiaceae bacterium]|nr:molybdopterin molybdotransferase MoeA [Dongiaceae bacterium]
MTQLTDDCFAGAGALTPIEAALDLILPRLVPVTAEETVDLAQALGRILRRDVAAPADVPGVAAKAGTVQLRAGRRLGPQDIWLAAALGATRLIVSRPLRVALFSTGDELAPPGAPLAPGQIYDSNGQTVGALLRRFGAHCTYSGILADRQAEVERALASAAAEHEVVVTSGGVSTGEEDHVKAALEALGTLHVWRLAIKPGRPVALGQLRRDGGGVPFIGLPGNPVAAMVTFLRVARPILLALMGGSELEPVRYRLRAAFEHRKKRERREFLRARLVREPDGALAAVKFPREGAGILSSLVEADGLVELPESLTRLEPGAMVDFLPFDAA